MEYFGRSKCHEFRYFPYILVGNHSFGFYCLDIYFIHCLSKISMDKEEIRFPTLWGDPNLLNGAFASYPKKKKPLTELKIWGNL